MMISAQDMDDRVSTGTRASNKTGLTDERKLVDLSAWIQYVGKGVGVQKHRWDPSIRKSRCMLEGWEKTSE